MTKPQVCAVSSIYNHRTKIHQPRPTISLSATMNSFHFSCRRSYEFCTWNSATQPRENTTHKMILLSQRISGLSGDVTCSAGWHNPADASAVTDGLVKVAGFPGRNTRDSSKGVTNSFALHVILAATAVFRVGSEPIKPEGPCRGNDGSIRHSQGSQEQV